MRPLQATSLKSVHLRMLQYKPKCWNKKHRNSSTPINKIGKWLNQAFQLQSNNVLGYFFKSIAPFDFFQTIKMLSINARQAQRHRLFGNSARRALMCKQIAESKENTRDIARHFQYCYRMSATRTIGSLKLSWFFAIKIIAIPVNFDSIRL